MKKTFAVLLTCLTVALASACTPGGTSSSSPAPESSAAPKAESSASQNTGDGGSTQDQTFTIAVVPKDAANPWFVRMQQGVEEYAKETGQNLFFKGPSECDPTMQVQIIQDLIAQQVDAICVVPIDTGALAPVLAKARESGILVVTHEGELQENNDYNIEAFDNAAYGEFMMQNLAAEMGEEGKYVTMVGQLTNASHNQWADAGVAYQKANYPNMSLIEEDARVESQDNSEVAYQVAKELLKKYPDLKGIMGCCSVDSPGVARAIEELGLIGKVFVTGTGMPAANKGILDKGIVKTLTVWDPAQAGKAMCAVAINVLQGNEITDGMDLGIEGYNQIHKVSDKLLTGSAWITVTKENVDSLGF